MSTESKETLEGNNKCTTCGTEIDVHQKQNLFKHVFLGTLVCQKCSEFYGDGDFSKHPDAVDDEGDDNYCRWCGDGGSLLVCCKDDCHYSYCEKCLLHNMGNKKYTYITESDDWNCFKCSPGQIKHLVDYCDKWMSGGSPPAKQNSLKHKVSIMSTPKGQTTPPKMNIPQSGKRTADVAAPESNGAGDPPKKRAFARKSTTPRPENFHPPATPNGENKVLNTLPTVAENVVENPKSNKEILSGDESPVPPVLGKQNKPEKEISSDKISSSLIASKPSKVTIEVVNDDSDGSASSGEQADTKSISSDAGFMIYRERIDKNINQLEEKLRVFINDLRALTTDEKFPDLSDWSGELEAEYFRFKYEQFKIETDYTGSENAGCP